MKRRGKRHASFDGELIAKAIGLMEQGLGCTDISYEVGRAPSTVSGWITKWKQGAAKVENGTLYYGSRIVDLSPQSKAKPDNSEPVRYHEPDDWPDMDDDIEKMSSAAKHSPAYQDQIKSAGVDRPDVTPMWSPDDISDMWERAEKQNEKAVNKAIHRSRFEANLGSDPVGITFVSDQHISARNSVCLKRMREDAELIAETKGLYACLGGDGVDNHVKHRSAIVNARSTPADQWLLYEYYLGIFAHKVLAMISGNHDAWTEAMAGVDMVNWIASKNRICYAPAEAHLDVSVGSHEYKISFRHQYRMNSTFNETHAVKQWLRHGDTPFDVGCVCHHHSPAIEECLIMGEHRLFCRPGSYQITSSHSRQYGYNLTTPTCPTVVFYPDTRRLIGFYDVKDAAKWLNMELGTK